MRKKDIIINSNSDKLPISVTMFIPEVDIKGIVQISHGMAEHKERYFDFMEYLANQGYVLHPFCSAQNPAYSLAIQQDAFRRIPC